MDKKTKAKITEIVKHLIQEENSAVKNKRNDSWLEGFGYALDIVEKYMGEVR